ncbi:hypothetical protein CMO96_04775 [Candidatus Woesebacteria bacterium]|nr:hypothetical protein [Candidatus Woesebacteria bacterium]|tara:strand:- start:2294 stop:3343 length:1050 start_codon:yes stop_codon:yes gene_type:complete
MNFKNITTLFSLLSLLVTFLFLGSTVLAQDAPTDAEMEEKAKAKGITFPISELGGCTNVSECRSFCEETANEDTCKSFAQKKGLKHTKRQYREAVLEQARDELGCDSFQDCKTLCEDEENRGQCVSFAAKQTHYGHAKDKQEMLERAKTVLNCTSFESCKNFCSASENQDRCDKFADQHAPAEIKARLEEHKENLIERFQENLSCDSIDSCKRLCKDPANKEKCDKSVPRTTKPGVEYYEIEKPSCEGEEECAKWCEENPDKCRSTKKMRGGEDEKKSLFDRLKTTTENSDTGTIDHQDIPKKRIESQPEHSNEDFMEGKEVRTEPGNSTFINDEQKPSGILPSLPGLP